ncbi:MAG: FAD-dependent oxidoreductase, partial [Ignavibacteria bacterium]|nr:FAD-dependent oxidoreductase [Ignavibacteria bacterium]
MKKKIIVIGAGPAGLTAAFKLAQAGCDVNVYEASEHVGGLARSFELWGQIVDCGPHRFFSNDTIVNDLFKEVVKDDYVNVNRLTRIYYSNKFFNYPLKVSNVLFNIGPVGVIQILFSYLKARLNPVKHPKTFEDWVINKFGKKLFNTFFKHYSEKLWGIPTTQLDADWAAQRIKNFSLIEAVKTALFGNGNKHKTLVEQFAYPKKGTGSIYEKLKTTIQQQGGIVFTNAPVEKILTENNIASGIQLKNGEQIFADEVISTMPLTIMVKSLKNVPQHVVDACDKLYFRNTI